MTLPTRTFALGVALATTLVGGAARAEPSDVDACADASENGQRLRDEGRFRAARAELLTCARSGCPGVVARDCIAFLAELDARTPTLVVRAKRANGDDAADFTLSLDGEDVPNPASGRAIPVDPGPHRLRFAVPGARPIERSVVAHEGELHRDVTVTFAATDAGADGAPADVAAAPRVERRSRFTPAVITLGAAGIAAIATASALGIKGVVDHDGYDACKPHCDPSAVDGTKRLVLVADVVGGVGLAATVVAAVLYFGGASASAPHGAPAVGVGPGSFTAGWSGRF